MKLLISSFFLFSIACSSAALEEIPIPPEQDLLGKISSALDSKNWKEGYTLCRRFITTYTSSLQVPELKKLQFEAVKNYVINGQKKKFLFIPYTVRRDALDCFNDTVKSYPYEAYTAEYIYWLGSFHLARREISDAEFQFKRITDRYKDTLYADKAFNILGEINYDKFEGEQYSSDCLNDAELYFARILDEYPNSEFVSNARDKITKIQEHLAKKLILAAEFYEWKGNKAGAIRYYKEVLLKYPNSSSVEHSQNALKKFQ